MIDNRSSQFVDILYIGLIFRSVLESYWIFHVTIFQQQQHQYQYIKIRVINVAVNGADLLKGIYSCCYIQSIFIDC